MQANTQSVPSRVLESAQVENGVFVFGLRRGVVRGELSEAASGEVDCGDDVLEGGHDSRRHLAVLCIGGSRWGCNAVCIVAVRLRALLGRRRGQVSAVGVGQRAGSDELKRDVNKGLAA